MARYPRRLNKFLLTASFATLFGAIKEIFGVKNFWFFIYLKVKFEELVKMMVDADLAIFKR